jgi:two-component system sensor histidine kinase/response regulator
MSGSDHAGDDFADDLSMVLRETALLVQSVSPDGRIRFANAAWKATLGYDDADIARGLFFLDLIAPDEREHCSLLFHRLLTGESVGRVETAFLARNGDRVDVRGDVRVRTDETGAMRATGGIFRDVREERRQQARHRALAVQNDVLLAALTEGVVLINADGRVEGINDAGVTILGAPRERMVGALVLEVPWRAFDHEGNKLERADHPIIRALRTGQPQAERLLRYPRPDGEERWIATAARPLYGEGGAVLGAVSSFRDVTAQVSAEAALRASEGQYRSLFERNASVQLLVDAESGTIRAVNPAAVLFYGYTEEELIGQHISLLSRLEPTTAVAMNAAVSTGQVTAFRRRQYLRSGEGREVEVFANPVQVGAHRVLHSIVFDVTARVEAEMRLREQAQELEVQTEELMQQSDELLAARDAADAANAAKSQFLAHMSHELRTPLTAIIGFSRVLAANRQGTASPQDVLYATRVATNAVRLLELINQLLDLSKVEAGQMELEWSEVDVRAMALDVVAELDGRARPAGVTLRAQVPDAPAFVRADATRLRQVVVNLAGNALKFTLTGEVVIEVSLSSAGHAKSIAVRDTGVGIAVADQASVFEPFAQADTSITRRFGGTGLGLAISRQYCDMMGFGLTLESEPDRGSRFSVEFR